MTLAGTWPVSLLMVTWTNSRIIYVLHAVSAVTAESWNTPKRGADSTNFSRGGEGGGYHKNRTPVSLHFPFYFSISDSLWHWFWELIGTLFSPRSFARGNCPAVAAWSPRSPPSLASLVYRCSRGYFVRDTGELHGIEVHVNMLPRMRVVLWWRV